MGATVRHPTERFHPVYAPTAKLRDAARVLGCSEATAEKRLWGVHAVNLQAARLVEMMLRRGDTEGVAQFLAPIEAARQGDVTGAVVESILAAAIADCGEDTAEARYQANPCPATAKALLEASALERERSLKRDAELRAKWEIGS